MAAPVRPGDIVKGKYRIDRELGEGGMGVVVAAHHVKLDQRVAIKFLKPELAADPRLATLARSPEELRFFRELGRDVPPGAAACIDRLLARRDALLQERRAQTRRCSSPISTPRPCNRCGTRSRCCATAQTAPNFIRQNRGGD